ncbi:hypothetical protein RRG08_066865 [Elysia crispata]|uniref:Uncharacterized protein n=1 Tax=Elysia crispata TaxID=231223 RepID=A0AAE0YE90_9GAST|nr:hypothetical protein RRG08_066865 [Elysia crispata]
MKRKRKRSLSNKAPPRGHYPPSL